MSTQAISQGERLGPHRVSAWRSSVVFASRSIRHALRDGETLVMSIMMPVVLMLLFTCVFGGAIFQDGGYIDFVVPGVLVLCVSQGSATTATAVARDMTNGVMNRFRTLPIAGATSLVGHVVASSVRNVIASLIVVGVAIVIGFRPNLDPLALLGAFFMLLLLILTLTAIMTAIGMASSSPDAASSYGMLFFILPYISSGFASVDTMPAWLRGFAEHQPYTPIIETLRGFLSGDVLPPSTLLAVVWCAGSLVLSVVVAAVVFPRKIARPVG